MNTNNEYFKEFQEDINSAWTSKLIREFNLQNDKIWRKIRKELTPPNFVFTNDNKTWGTWDLANRTITLSYKLFRDFEWDALVHTLKHEMAHMITSEIWSDVSDNGNRWRRKVLEKDNYTCQHCGFVSQDKKGLASHHLWAFTKYWKKRFKINNGITLCISCHKKFHSIYGRGNNTPHQFTKFQAQK